ncbi:NADH dehydrogenase (ubiquinone) 1, subcomplex unknown, 2 isoform 8-like protein [Camelus ferus]|nr:NADH dehydrogenase (ubiquinone) 1, subcomplex unknown, 2 isoform 8-like protein [Camelus ferus]
MPLQLLPDEARSLPPPKLTDPRLAYVGFLGYCSGLIDNAIRRRPVVSAARTPLAAVGPSNHLDVTTDFSEVIFIQWNKMS